MNAVDVFFATGLNSRSVTRWRDGEHDPSFASIRRLCEGLSVSADYLFSLTSEIEPGVVYPPEGFDEPPDITALGEIDPEPPASGGPRKGGPRPGPNAGRRPQRRG